MTNENPDLLPKQDEAYCFFDKNRPCTAECVAYKTVGVENDQLDPVQQHCVVLSGVERAGRGIIAIASVSTALAKKWRTRQADEQRSKATSNQPPNPGGR